MRWRVEKVPMQRVGLSKHVSSVYASDLPRSTSEGSTLLSRIDKMLFLEQQAYSDACI